MKVNKISQSLVLFTLTGAITLMGTPMAFAAECSTLSPCVVNSVPSVVSSVPNVSSDLTVQVTTPSVQSITAPVAPAVDSVTNTVAAAAAPAAGTINKVTAPITDTVNSVVTPIAPVLQGPMPVPQPEPIDHTEQPVAASVEPVVAEPDGKSSEIVSPPDTKSASVTPDVAQSHDSSATASGLLNGTTTLAPNLLDFQSAAVHSSQGYITKVMDSGAFGFGHIDPVDSPTFTGLVFAYIIALGSAIGVAVKRSAFLNFGTLT